MTVSSHHFPRLFCPQSLTQGMGLALNEDQSHYLRNVLRKKIGDKVRLFNEVSGEWVAVLSAETKKFITVTMEQHIRSPETDTRHIHLIFSPIKKDRNDMIIEKAVELGVTHVHPVLFARTIVRDIKVERIQAQMIEAAEQCERLSLPHLSPLIELKKLLAAWDKEIPMFAGIERTDSVALINAVQEQKSSHVALLIGPEGGIAPDEVELLATKSFVQAVSLGTNILRAETAVFYGLSVIGAVGQARHAGEN